MSDRIQPRPWLRRLLIASAVFMACVLFGYLNRFSTTQSGALLYHINLMNYYRGVQSFSYCLYPVWGYPLLMSLFPRWEDVIYLQIVLGGLVAALFYLQIDSLLRTRSGRRLWAFLMITAIPCFAVVSVRWPASIQMALIVSGISVLLLSIRAGRRIPSILAGLLFGMACNFRSEYLYFPFFLLFSIAVLKLLRPGFITWAGVRLLFVFAASALLAMVPLGLDRLERTGRFSIKVGNGDWTNVFFSIGQYPGNQLSLRFDDGWVETYLRENIDAPYDTTQMLHMQAVANDYSRRAFFSYLGSCPGDFLAKILHNAKSILLGGFYCGQIEAGMGEDSPLRMVLLKEFYKRVVGISNSIVNMQALYAEGLIESPDRISLADVVDHRTLVLLPLFLVGAFFGIVNLVFYLLLLARIFMRLKGKSSFTVEELVFLLCIMYGNGLMILGMYENRFANVYYLFLAAFVVLSVDRLLPLARRKRLPAREPVPGTRGRSERTPLQAGPESGADGDG